VLRDLVATKVDKGDNVFIYYAGHGWYDNILESGHWVTTEASKSPGTFLDNNTIYKFIAALDKKGAQHILLVSDSCFAGAFIKEHRAVETDINDRYFQEKYSKPSRNILTSGGIEPVEDVGKGGHSVFAYYFLKALHDNPHPYLSAKQLGVQVEELVTRNSTQTPLSRFIHGVGDEGGQFFFIASSSGAIVEEPSGKEAMTTLCMKFVLIPQGAFMMGSPPDQPGRYSDETQHRVTLTRALYVQTTEVTVGQWRAFVRDTGYQTEAETKGGAYIWTGSTWKMKAGYYWDNAGFSQSEDNPVTCVSWNDVQEFMRWLRRKEGKTYRLPTEAEWEYACRAGTTKAFANGDITELECGHDPNLAAMGWYCGNSERKTHPVAQKKPNAWGLYDMHGKVWEWCHDWYQEQYPSAHVIDPKRAPSGTYRVLRGGGWDGYAWDCRSANRVRCYPGDRDDHFGFRVARDF
jgi:formylglycine-generating enzyme required for sulfatase activity